MDERLPVEGVSLRRSERVLHLWSDQPFTVTSSAVVGADVERTRHILNMRVEKDYASMKPWEDLAAMARELGIRESFVGLMTAAQLEKVHVISERDSQTTVVAVVTVGLRHPVAAGVSDVVRATAGTINIILVTDARLNRAARVNAVITATESKTLALAEAGVRVPHGGLASGTATDAVVVAATERGPSCHFSGPASPLGVLIASSVRRAMQRSLAPS